MDVCESVSDLNFWWQAGYNQILKDQPLGGGYSTQVDPSIRALRCLAWLSYKGYRACGTLELVYCGSEKL